MINIVFLFAIGQFICFALACFTANSISKIFLSLSYLLVAIMLRILVPIESNDDFHVYSELFDYSLDVNQGLFVLFDEPLIRIVHLIFGLFLTKNESVLYCIYAANFIVINVFLIHLIFVKKVSAIGKILWFAIYYFLFSYVVLRNGLVYISFAWLIVTEFRRKKLVLISPLSHLSGFVGYSALLFLAKRNYVVFIILPVAIFITFLFFPKMESIYAINKLRVYLDSSVQDSIGHYILLALVIGLYGFRRLSYKNTKILVLLRFLLWLYILGFIIKPVVGARLAPFLLTVVLLYPIEKPYIKVTRGLETLLTVIFCCVAVLINVLFFNDCHELSF